MSHAAHLDAALLEAIGPRQGCPPRLFAAMVDAVVPGGARLRPSLCLAVATSYAPSHTPLPTPALRAAVAIELLHCASLVHDDLPCFDDASLRRGRATIHSTYGQATATLVGDGLIAAAFAHIGMLSGQAGNQVRHMVGAAARRMVWGQALEAEAEVDLGIYHGHKTAALFEAAAACGAWLAADGLTPTAHDIDGWRAFGAQIGALYQTADDILDACSGRGRHASKTAGRDARHNRPSRVLTLGLPAAQRRLQNELNGVHATLVRVLPRHRRVGKSASVDTGAADTSGEAGISHWFANFVRRLQQQPELMPRPATTGRMSVTGRRPKAVSPAATAPEGALT